MKGIIDDNSNQCEAIVEDETSYDLTGKTVVEVPAALLASTELHKIRWDMGTSQFIERAPTYKEAAKNQLTSDTVWQALKNATPSELDTWLNANMKNNNDIQAIIKALIMAIQLINKGSV